MSERAAHLVEAVLPCEAARAHLLAWLIESDFWTEVRQAHGHGYGFWVDYSEERDTSVLSLKAEIPVSVLARVLAKLRERWGQWAQHGFDADLLAAVRSGAAAHTVLDGRTSASLAEHLAHWWAGGRSIEELDRWAATLAALDQDKMRASAALCRANLVLGLAADRGLAEAAVKLGWKD